VSEQKISHYRIIKKLGAGGMGEVYLAEDTTLNRKVALKFLPFVAVHDRERMRRFLQEAHAAATLHHENITHIYEVGEADGKSFIVMEYVEGQTLDSKINERPLSTDEIVYIGGELADALDEAHSKGITHRDIKPSNIIITTRGHAKVLDFGLAKVTMMGAERAASDLPTQIKTRSGVVMGTVEYMSPEQALGREVDHRTDIFSLGVVLYEMATGRRPFAGASVTETIDRIAHAQPEAIARFNYAVPPELERIIRKCLEKDRERRYQSARELLIDLQKLQRDSDTAQTTSGEKTRLQTRAPAHRTAVLITVLVVALLAAAGLGLYWVTRWNAPFNSIAVLPLVNASADPDTEFLSDGLTESLINSLSRLPKVKVISLSSVMHYKGQQVDPQAVGNELGVSALLIGRIVKRGDNLSIGVELVDARDKSHLWGEQYDRKFSELLVVQGEIAKDVAEKLRLRLSGEEQKRLTKPYTDNGEAYQLYLKGRYYSSKQLEAEIKRGIEYFNQAIYVDPNYALAYAGLADAYYGLSYLYLPPKEAMPKARAAAMKALELDNTISEAHTSLANVKTFYEWDWSGAEKEYQRAIALNPNYATAYQWYGWHLALTGRPDESLTQLKKAQEIDPLSIDISWSLGASLFFAHRYDQAIQQLQKTLEMDPNMPLAHFHLGASYEQKGMSKEAIEELRKASDLVSGSSLASLGHAYAVFGKRDEALKILDELKNRSERGRLPAYEMAIIYTGLGDKDRAFEWLEKGYEDRSELMTWLKVDPRLDSLRSDLRFTRLMQRVGLSP
jgi:serine/threonine protein kinase/tetratricopeptide (TPR) repeat protein